MYGDGDEDEDKDSLLKMLSGEVDDFAGSKLDDPSKPASQGVTIEISVKPHGEGETPPEPKEPSEEETAPGDDMTAGNPDHDPIAHILGLCRGGCV